MTESCSLSTDRLILLQLVSSGPDVAFIQSMFPHVTPSPPILLFVYDLYDTTNRDQNPLVR